jgi:hypothetical protein
MDKNKYPWNEAWDSLKRTIEEDCDALKALVDNEDSACNARNLRLMSELERWEW